MAITKSVSGPIETLNSSTIISKPAEELTLPEQVHSYALLTAVEVVIKERKETLREPLLAEAMAGGDKDEKGSAKILVEGCTVKNETRRASQPDPDKLRELLQSKGLDPSIAFTKVVIPAHEEVVPDPSKIEALVAVGKLTKKEAAAIYPETRALKIVPSKELKEFIDSFKKSVPGPKALTE